MRDIQEIQSELESNVVAISEIKVEKLKAEDKRERIYNIGSLLNELREQHPSNEEYGEAVRQFLSEIAERNTDRKIPAERALRYHRQLPEFGELWECELVGFTNVYKLSVEGQEDFKAEVKSMLSEVNPHDLKGSKALVANIKGLVTERFKVRKYSEEELNVHIAHASRNTSPEERDALRQEGARSEYYRLLGINPDDYETDVERMAVVKAFIRRDERLFHPDRNLDNPDKFVEQFERTQRMKEFFNV